MSKSADNPARQVLAAAATSIFRPLVKMLLRCGISYKTCAQWLRWSYVDVAMTNFKLDQRKQSKSRVAILTGLSRVEVDHMLKITPPQENPGEEEYHRAARVLTGWAYDSAYQDGHGRPTVLKFEGGSPSFSSLVERYAGGAPPRAVLDELVRVGSVSVSPGREISLIKAGFVSADAERQLDSLKIMGLSTSRLMQTIDYNLKPETEPKRLQLLAFSRRIPAEKLERIEAHILSRGRDVIAEIDQFLFEESAPDSGLDSEDLYRAGLGMYYFEDDKSDS